MTRGRTDRLRHEVLAHVARTPREQRARGVVLRYLAWLPDPCDEQADPVHVTGSAIVLDDEGTATVLHRHRRLGSWLQPGGHVDPGEDPGAAALREAGEETGLALVHHAGTPTLVHVDVHEGGRGHLHLDLRYLLRGDAAAPFRPAPGESPELAWVGVDDVAAFSDTSVADAVAAAVAITSG